MTRHLDEMGFTFRRGTPKQIIIIRELKKLVLLVYFSMKHCFPTVNVPYGMGYGKIQSSLWHSNLTVKDVLYDLGSNYVIINPVRGFARSPACGDCSSATYVQHGIDMELTARDRRQWQMKARNYCQEKCGLGKRYKFKKFCSDDLLQKIRLDRTLTHIPKSQGCFKEVAMTNQSKKPRRSATRCLMCSTFAVTPEEKKRISKTIFYCSTCSVHLCIKPKGKAKFSCFQRWHHVKNLTQVLTVKKATPKRKK